MVEEDIPPDKYPVVKLSVGGTSGYILSYLFNRGDGNVKKIIQNDMTSFTQTSMSIQHQGYIFLS